MRLWYTMKFCSINNWIRGYSLARSATWLSEVWVRMLILAKSLILTIKLNIVLDCTMICTIDLFTVNVGIHMFSQITRYKRRTEYASPSKKRHAHWSVKYVHAHRRKVRSHITNCVRCSIRFASQWTLWHRRQHKRQFLLNAIDCNMFILLEWTWRHIYVFLVGTYRLKCAVLHYFVFQGKQNHLLHVYSFFTFNLL